MTRHNAQLSAQMDAVIQFFRLCVVPAARITARVTLTDANTDGVIVAQGGRVAGFSLYFDDGVPVYRYSFFGRGR